MWKANSVPETITTICLTFELPTEEQLAAHQHKDEILEQSLQTLSVKTRAACRG
mgnify:CR=1 FL=1